MPRTIRQGDTGSDVRECQSLLCAHGFITTVDGIFGAATTNKVKAFQSSQKITPDGIVGPNTWIFLQSTPTVTGPLNWQQVVALFPQMMPQTYVLTDAQCPSNPPGVSLKNLGQETTNCVLFTAWLLSKAFSGVRFAGTQWADWMVASDISSNAVPGYGPKVVQEWGCGTTSPGEGPWLVQFFRSNGTGHSLIVVDHDLSTDKILTLEASSTINGAGWYDIGPLREVFNPGPDWCSRVNQTWSSRLGGVYALHMIRLNISTASIREWLQEGA